MPKRQVKPVKSVVPITALPLPESIVSAVVPVEESVPESIVDDIEYPDPPELDEQSEEENPPTFCYTVATRTLPSPCTLPSYSNNFILIVVNDTLELQIRYYLFEEHEVSKYRTVAFVAPEGMRSEELKEMYNEYRELLKNTTPKKFPFNIPPATVVVWETEF